MDYFDSEVTESLDFLSPPVKRIYRHTERERVYQPNNAFNQHNRLLRDFRTTVAKQTRAQLPALERPDGPSSTSLVLKRTTEREILERYSVLSYTNLQYSNHIKHQTINPPDRERPLIKVTVIPKNVEEAQTAKLRKRRQIKKVQSTVSNQENSIKAKNVYLVVAGRKREKIYEIKTTGSAEFSNNLHFKDGDSTIEQVPHFKQLISSLNMDKKKKKAKKKDVAPKGSGSSLVKQVLEGPDTVFRDCSCFNDIQSGAPKDVRLRKSRVRISGKIGVTDDDRYILKCAATVNDKPAETSNMQRSFVQCRNGRFQKDSNIQADFRNEKSKKTQEIHHMRSKETQCTQYPQDNFNTVCFSNIEKLQISSKKDQLVQCHCLQPSEDVVRYEYESETTKDSSSPLVIISVYPKQDSSERVIDKSPVRNNTTRPSKNTNVYNMNAKRFNNERLKPANDTNKREIRPGTRSPSPSRSPTRSRFDNNQEKGRSRLDQDKLRSSLNDNQETGTVRKKMIYKETCPTNTKKPNKPEQGKPKPKQTAPQARPDIKRQTNQKYYSGQKVAAGTNTDHILQKKALVDSYTQKLAAQMRQKKAMNWTAPKNDVSNVTINIDGETEFYDVLFRQGDLTTDLRVRKTVKNQGSQKGYGEDDNSASLENFFLITQDEPRTSFSQVYLDEPSYQPDNLAMLDTVSRLNVRDSIEISHRREDRISICARSGRMPLSYKVYSSETNSEENRNFFAPIKHYRGDSCALANPVQRDREIRELLGIRTGRPNTSRAIEEESMSANDDHSLHCFYQTTCDNTNFGSDIQDSMCSIYKSKPPCCCDTRESNQFVSNKPVDSVSKVKESKQIEQKLSKTSNKQQPISIPKDSDQSDSDDSKDKPEDSDQSDSDESKQKSNDSDQTDSDESKQKPIEKQKKSNIKSFLGSLTKGKSSKPKDSDQTDTDEQQNNDQKTSNSLKKRKTIKPTDSDQVDSDDLNQKPNESDQSDSDDSKQQLKQSDESDSDDSKQQLKQSDESDSDDSKQKPIDSDQSDSNEHQKINHQTSNSLKKRKTDSEKLKQTPMDHDDDDQRKIDRKSRHSLKRGKSSKPKDSDQSDSDDQPKIDPKSHHSLKREKSSKPKESDQSNTDDQRKIDHKSHHSLKTGKFSKLKDSDQSDSDQQKIDRKSHHSLKKGKSSKLKDSDQSDSDDQPKIDRKSHHFLQKGKSFKLKDSDQFDSDHPRKIDHISRQSPKRGKSSEPKDTVQSDSDDQHKIDRRSIQSLKKLKSSKVKDPDDQRKIHSRSRDSLKKRKSSKPKDLNDQHKIDRRSSQSLKKPKSSKLKNPDQSDSGDQRKIDNKSRFFLKKGKSSKSKDLDGHRKIECRCSCSHKKEKYSKPKDKSNFDDQRKIDRSSSESLKKRQISGKHEESEPWDSVESINDNFYATDSDKHLKSKTQQKSVAPKSRHKNLYKPYAVDQAPLYQQLILNRNINVYLQIEQFTKQKPIVLSRKQYDKVKKTIENASTKRTKMCICTKSSSISLGEVRKKPKTVPTHYHKSVQSEAGAKLNINEQKQGKIEETTKDKIMKDGLTEPIKDNFIEPSEQILKIATETPKQMSKEDSKEKAKEKEMIMEIEKAREKIKAMEMEKATEKEKAMEKAREKEKAEEKEKAMEMDKAREKEKAKEKEKAIEKEIEEEKEKEKAREKAIEKETERAKRKEKEKSKEKGKEKSKKGEKIKIKCCDYCGKTQPAVPVCCEYCGKKKNKSCNNCGRPLYYVAETCPSYNVCPSNNYCPSYNNCYYCGLDQGKTVVLYEGKFKKPDEPVNINESAKSPGHAASSVEVRYTSVAYMKHVTFSSTKVAEQAKIPSTSNIAKQNNYHSDSLYTIFKGHRKTPTPNLGTSAYSLNSEYSDARSPKPQDLKARKPFLKRLMSCLVMRSKASETKIGRPVPKMTSVNSSVDSYHISTSLGAIELSSSIYDTSASFYSNHTILPMNSKIKRGFFSSVRGFLTTNRRS